MLQQSASGGSLRSVSSTRPSASTRSTPTPARGYIPPSLELPIIARIHPFCFRRDVRRLQPGEDARRIFLHNEHLFVRRTQKTLRERMRRQGKERVIIAGDIQQRARL